MASSSSSSPVYRLFTASLRSRTATARPRRITQPLRRNLHFSACDRQQWPASQPKTQALSTPCLRTRETRRLFSVSAVSRHGHLEPPKPGEERKVTFVDKEGDSFTFTVSDGDNLLDIAQANDLEMEGACGGSCACSTCHVIVTSDSMYDAMPEPEDDENDMLDLAFGLTETSRLGCQVKMAKDLDGLVVKLPSMTRNLQASDFEDKKKS